MGSESGFESKTTPLIAATNEPTRFIIIIEIGPKAAI